MSSFDYVEYYGVFFGGLIATLALGGFALVAWENWLASRHHRDHQD